MEQFPVGGNRAAVYEFLQQHGWMMSKHSDKHWHRHKGQENLHLYGSGSQAIITRSGQVLYDGPLDGVSSI